MLFSYLTRRENSKIQVCFTDFVPITLGWIFCICIRFPAFWQWLEIYSSLPRSKEGHSKVTIESYLVTKMTFLTSGVSSSICGKSPTFALNRISRISLPDVVKSIGSNPSLFLTFGFAPEANKSFTISMCPSEKIWNFQNMIYVCEI